jgi:WD40 repeat protein
MPDDQTEPLAEPESQLDAVIAEYLTALQSGRCPDREALLRQHPELAGPLAEFFVDHDHFERLAGLGPGQPDTAQEPAAPPTPAPEASTCGPSAVTAPSLPSALRQFGDYVLTAEIARGGMGVVYRATQVSLKRPVALKMILGGHLASAVHVERFHREAEAAARLDHPQIVPIYEVGEHAGTHYFSMKLVEGGDLTQHLPRFAGDPHAAAGLTAKLADAVHHAHQRGVLHRDLKPRNILLDDDGEPQITDFGLAKQVDASGELTESGAIVGTAAYMAPEQARGEKTITTAVDVYSLGAILYELLTGRPPFRDATPAQTIARVLDHEPVRPRAIRPDVDRDLETVCLKCLEKDPTRRYGSAAALADELRRWLAGLPITARPAGPAERLWRWCRRNPVLAISSGLILALIAAFSWWLWDENQQTRAALWRESLALQEVQAAHAEAQDHLARSLYEQALAVGLSALPETRWTALELLKQAGALQRRRRETRAGPSGEPGRLPRPWELRSEAVGALLRHDLRLAWQQNMELIQPALDGDGRRVLFREGRGLALLDWGQREPQGRWTEPAMLGSALAVDPSGRWLVSWNHESDELSIWDLAAGSQTQTLPWPADPRGAGFPASPAARPAYLVSSDLTWSPTAKHLAAIDRREDRQTLVLWDLAVRGLPRSLISVPQDTNRGGARFTADGSQLAYPTGEQTVAFWQTASGDRLREVRLALPLVGGVALGPAGRDLLCACAGEAGRDGTLIHWDLANDRETWRLATDFSLRGAVVAFDDAGKRAALGTRGGRLSIVEAGTGRILADRPGVHPFAVGLMGWSHDGRRLASWGIAEGRFKCWDVADPPITEVRTSPKVRHFTLSPDGKRLAAADGQEPRIRLFDRAGGTAERDLWGSDPATRGLLVFSPDGRQLAEVNAYRVIVWDVLSGQLLVRLERASGWEGLITSVAFSPEGSLLASVFSAGAPRVAVWDVLHRREVWRAPADSPLHTAYLVPGGCLLAGISQPALTARPQLTVIELATSRVVTQADAPGVPLDWNSFSPDGKWVAALHPSGDDNAPALFAAVGTSIHAEIVLHRFPENGRQRIIAGSVVPTATAFSPDSRLLAIGYRDGCVRLCRVADGEELFRSRLRSRPITQLVLSGDSATLAVTDGLDSIQLLDLPRLREGLLAIGLDW